MISFINSYVRPVITTFPILKKWGEDTQTPHPQTKAGGVAITKRTTMV